jgi:glutamyl-Q tRNA(Asp) synthetase
MAKPPQINPPKTYRGRFAPSPSGPLHFGSLVAALGSYLDAHHHHGEWWVRMEDLDPPREMAGAADDILRTLEAFGLHWHGSVVYQSQRSEIYQTNLKQLQVRELAYPCVCSRKTIAKQARSGRFGPIYPGTCRAGIPANQNAHALRIRTDRQPIIVDDRLQGSFCQVLEEDLGDFIIQRADGYAAYQLAVVIDDHEQGITDVVRGSDLLECTPRQIYLQQLLGIATPRYLHLPVALHPQGDKLSKQTHAPAVSIQPIIPLLIRALAFLGQQPPTELHDATVAELLAWATVHWQLQQIPAIRSQAPQLELQKC